MGKDFSRPKGHRRFRVALQRYDDVSTSYRAMPGFSALFHADVGAQTAIWQAVTELLERYSTTGQVPHLEAADEGDRAGRDHPGPTEPLDAAR
jgi:hypothetical protein